MTIEDIRKYCGSQRGTREELPFGPTVLVFKVQGKMYALLAWHENPLVLSLKCDPDRAQALRDSYPAITAAYHMNKKHWNMIRLDGSLTVDQIKDLIDHSYQLVVQGLKRAQREQLQDQ